jgi:hypothetical protein
MNHALTRALIVEALREQRPSTPEAALEIARGILREQGAGKEMAQFSEWFDRHGQDLVRRINA